MQSKNKRAMTAAERRHAASVAALPCSVCSVEGPSEVHEMQQGDWYTSIALCTECHRGAVLGWHGQKRAWAIRKMGEIDALSVTIERLVGGRFE